MARYTIPKIKYNPPTEELTEEMVLKTIGEMSYQSPVEISTQNIREKFEGDVMRIIHSYGINVDKDELVKALQYDREQYKQGFADGSKLRTDVIKAEVAREIFEEIEAEMTEALKCNYKRRTEYYTKERYHKECGEFINTVSGKIDALRGIEGFVKELKKKYMGEQK